MKVKKLISIAIATAIFLLCSIGTASAITSGETIPATMDPNTIIEYDDNCEAQVTVTVSTASATTSVYVQEPEDTSGREEEDAKIAAIMEAAKDLPVYTEEYVLPIAESGMRVVYGSDGQINHIYNAGGVEISATAAYTALTLGTRKAAGTYTWGTSSNKLVITSTQVTGTGRGTVFDDTIGESDNNLQSGDCALRGDYDNPYHGTVIDVRNLDNDIYKQLYKRDNGALPNAVIDIWKWSSSYQYFGEYYSSTLSFSSMRYWYSFA